MEEKQFTLINLWSDQYQEGCGKLSLRVWWVTAWNGSKGTIYEPRNKLYEQEGWH